MLIVCIFIKHIVKVEVVFLNVFCHINFVPIPIYTCKNAYFSSLTTKFADPRTSSTSASLFLDSLLVKGLLRTTTRIFGGSYFASIFYEFSYGEWNDLLF